MSYINIHEVDKTIQDLAPAQNDNIVYVPLNSTDGPSGVYNVLNDYSDFVSIYGHDPNPNSAEMTSWDFAANLLLRKMPVMVRRITKEIDEYGNDKNVPLEGAELATGLLKVKNVTGSYASNNSSEPKTEPLELNNANNLTMTALKSAKSNVVRDKDSGEITIENLNTIEILTSSSLQTPTPETGVAERGLGIAVKVNDAPYEFDVAATMTNMDLTTHTIPSGGGVYVENLDPDNPVYITELVVSGLKYNSSTYSLLTAESSSNNKLILPTKDCLNYVITDEKSKEVRWSATSLSEMVNNGYLCVVTVNEKGNSTINKNKIKIVEVSGSKSQDQCIPAIELPAGCKLQYTLPYGDNYISVQTWNNEDYAPALAIGTFVANNTENRITVTNITPLNEGETENEQLSLSGGIQYIENQIESETESINNAPEYDDKGNLNLFKLYYKHYGENGNRFSASLKTVQGDGIYLLVYAGEQRVENIQLVNFRYKNKLGRYAYLDVYADRGLIWKMFLSNFGITYNPNTKEVEVGEYGHVLSTNYLDVELNSTITRNFESHLDSIYMCRGDIRWQLSGGHQPDDDCVEHEVYKTYAPLADKYLYDVKFVSNGGFVDKEIMPESVVQMPQIDENTRFIEDAQVALAETRGDCLAFVDTPMDLDKDSMVDYFSHISTSYATSYAPWVKMNLLTRATKWCPPSFVALWTIAKSVNAGNSIYAPPAGVNRANVAECQDLFYQIPSEYIDTWQDNHTQFINPIVYINGYGVNIFGQKTLYNKVDASSTQESALQYLNVRLVANEIKKRIFKTCIELTFEYNNLHTWLSFKSKMKELLDVLLYNHAITYYDIRMDESTMTTADIRANHIVGIVSVAVSNTAEKFDITFELLPNQVNFINIDYSTNSTDDAISLS